MRLADANDYVFDSLMNDGDKIAYNLFSVIRNDKSAFIVTDDKYYIYAQNSRRSPHWLFIKEEPDEGAFEEIVALIAGMLKLNPLLRISGRPDYIKPILDVVSERYGANHIIENTMTVYSCSDVNSYAKRRTPPDAVTLRCTWCAGIDLSGTSSFTPRTVT